MTTTERPPAGIEYKAAALAPPAPARSGTGAFDLSGDPEGTVWAIVAVTGGEPDAVGDVILPGALARTLREREIKIVLGHDWNRPVGRVLSAVELLPGDPRLPRTLADGLTPWSSANGALLVKARYILGTRDGRDAYEHAKAFGHSTAYSIGYKVTPNGARHRGGVRYITDLDVFEASPVLHGAAPHARLLAVKGSRPAGLQVKAAAPVLSRRRVGTPVGAVTDCAACGRPTAAVVGGGLRPGESMLCAACVRGAYEDVRAGLLGEPGTDTAVIHPAELAEVDRITAEDEYVAALADEIGWEMETYGHVHPLGDGPAPDRYGRAWTRRPPTTGWGRP